MSRRPRPQIDLKPYATMYDTIKDQKTEKKK